MVEHYGWYSYWITMCTVSEWPTVWLLIHTYTIEILGDTYSVKLPFAVYLVFGGQLSTECQFRTQISQQSYMFLFPFINTQLSLMVSSVHGLCGLRAQEHAMPPVVRHEAESVITRHRRPRRQGWTVLAIPSNLENACQWIVLTTLLVCNLKVAPIIGCSDISISVCIIWHAVCRKMLIHLPM